MLSKVYKGIYIFAISHMRRGSRFSKQGSSKVVDIEDSVLSVIEIHLVSKAMNVRMLELWIHKQPFL